MLFAELIRRGWSDAEPRQARRRQCPARPAPGRSRVAASMKDEPAALRHARPSADRNECRAAAQAAIIPVTPLQQNCTLLWCTKTMRGAFVDPGGDLDRLKAAAAAGRGDDREDPADPRPYRPLRIGRASSPKSWACRSKGRTRTTSSGSTGWPRMAPATASPASRSSRRAGSIDGDTVDASASSPSTSAIAPATPPATSSSTIAVEAGDGRRCPVQGLGRALGLPPRQSAATCIDSITSRLWPMGDDTAFVPGHGPMSTFGHERRPTPLSATVLMRHLKRGEADDRGVNRERNQGNRLVDHPDRPPARRSPPPSMPIPWATRASKEDDRSAGKEHPVRARQAPARRAGSGRTAHFRYNWPAPASAAATASLPPSPTLTLWASRSWAIRYPSQILMPTAAAAASRVTVGVIGNTAPFAPCRTGRAALQRRR